MAILLAGLCAAALSETLARFFGKPGTDRELQTTPLTTTLQPSWRRKARFTVAQAAQGGDPLSYGHPESGNVGFT